jgi:hypothetical protein
MKKTSIRAIVLLALLLAAGRADAADLQEVLARAKEAAGGKAWDDVRALRSKVKIEMSGLSGQAESWEDVRTGRYAGSFSLGSFSGAQGFDGKNTWVRDTSGQVRVSDSGDAREGSANEAYRRTLAWWYPERWPAEISLVGDRQEGDRSFHVLRIHPKGGRPFEMWIDARTWLTDRVVEQASRETRTGFMSDYRDVGGLKLPFTQRNTNGETKYDQVLVTESVEVNPEISDATFRMPEGGTNDFEIQGGKTSATLPFELLNNHIFVKVRLDGKEPLHMFLDTGGMNVVTPEVAKRLGLEGQGAIQGRGVGEKTEDVALTQVKEMRVGDAVLRDQTFFLFPLRGISEVEGVQVDGIIGYEVFKRFTVRIDYAKKLLTFTLPEAFDGKGAGTAVAFTFDEQTPQVDGEIDGIPGKFTIDTGSRNSLDLTAPFVEAHGLVAKYAPKVEAMTGFGVGGGVRSAVTRAKLLKLGAVEVPAPVTSFSLNKKGSLASRYVAGNVGGGVLRRFTVTFDYSRQTIWLAPNKAYAAPDTYDRAGLWLNRAEDGFKVEDVVAHGPAAEAGLRVGDTILAIDGKGPADLSLAEVRTRFRDSAPGTPVRLTVRSGGETREVAVVLRELV